MRDAGDLDTLIEHAWVVRSSGFFRGDVGIRDGRIAWIRSEGGEMRSAAARNIIPADGLYLIPGLIESHLHTRVPAFSHREDFFTGTAAAAAGGITTVFEMPVSRPPTWSVEILEERLAHAQNQALVDFAFYGAAGEENLAQIPALAQRGVIGFKTFTQGPPPGREREFIGLCAKTSASLLKVFRAVSKTGLVCALHAEEDSLISLFRSESQGDTLADWADCRPPLVEIEAIARSLVLAREAGVRLAICHVSTPESVELIEAFRKAGQEVYIETCPHYLFSCYEEAGQLGPFAKIKPPLRNKAASSRMLDMFVQGRIDYIGSDHAPFTAEEKIPTPPVPLFSAPDGLAAMELTLPLFLSLARKGVLKMNDLVRICCEQPARIFNIFPVKGILQEGADADLVLVDLDRVGRVDLGRLQTKAKACAKIYENREVVDGIRLTLVRGQPVYQEGTIIGTPGWGKWLRSQRKKEET